MPHIWYNGNTNMNREKAAKFKNLKVIIAEAIMVVAVIATVVILALIVSGYWINSDFEVERQGMLQVSSVPTGANVEIDGESSWLQRTNTSKTLPSGEHTVKLTRDGYDSWSKTINIREGLLYRLHYPRLFLNDRLTEKLQSIKGATFATVSPNHETLLLVNKTTEWNLINLDNDEIKTTKLNIAGLFTNSETTETAKVGIFSGEILYTDWSNDNQHLLIKTKTKDSTEWVLIDIANIKNSINLTKEFGTQFASLKIINDSATSLLAIQDGNLRRVDVSGRQISAILVERVIDYDFYDNEVVFSAENTNKDGKKYYVGILKFGDEEVERLKNTDDPIKVAVGKFYDDKYLVLLRDKHLEIHQKDDFSRSHEFDLAFAPDDIKIGYQGTFIIMSKGTQIATLDMEAQLVREWQVDGDKYGWIDNNMIYSVKEGELMVYDFDGLNRRIIAKNVSNQFPVMITEDRWLYYVSDTELVREWLLPR